MSGPGLAKVAAQVPNHPQVQEWVVFAICFVATLVGVLISFLLFGTVIASAKFWPVALIITVVMIGISYGTKYSREISRRSLNPLELVHFLAQGFLWPSTWPALAAALGIVTIAAPKTTGGG